MSMTSEALFEDLAIRVRGGESAQYFYGDNLKGFYEGFTNRTAQGAGYLVRDRAIYRDMVSRCGVSLLRREEAVEAVIYPHCIRHVYESLRSEEFTLLSGQNAVALRVTSAKAAVMSISPLLDIPADRASIRCGKKVTLIQNRGADEFVAIASATPFTYEGVQKHEQFLKPKFTTTEQVTEFLVYLAFGSDEETAVDRVERLVQRDGVAEHRAHIHDVLTRSSVNTGLPDYDRALMWAKLTSYFLVVEEFGKGIWAGLPWFRDNWGRDTFIAFPGTLLAAGLFNEARDVLRNFLRYQNTDPKSKDYGRVPNRVASATDIIYNTTDGTPWLIREAYEYLSYTGDTAFVSEIYPAVKLALNGAIKNFVDDRGFLTHDDADTWMDARIMGNLPWSARGNRANDIQALWFTALQCGAEMAELEGDRASAAAWNDRAAKLKKNFPGLFWDSRHKRMADRVEADDRPDYKVRPNQLMLISVPLVDSLVTEAQGEAIVRNAVSELLYPYGIASLSQNDPYFHPHHHHDDWYHFDSAYHNGTVWGWNAGFTTTAMCRHGQTELAWKLARNLSAQILNEGCRGSMSELIEAMPGEGGGLRLSGTWAQAWSTAEFVRNAQQDFCGFQPRLLQGEILLEPHIPTEWMQLTAVHAFGETGRLAVSYKRNAGRVTFVLKIDGYDREIRIRMKLDVFGRRYDLGCNFEPSDCCIITVDKSRGAAVVGGQTSPRTALRGTKISPPKPLNFARPSLKSRPPALREKDYLKKIIEAGKYQ